MKFFQKKIWFFVFFSVLFLLFVFYFKAGYTKLFSASLTAKTDELPAIEFNPTDDLPPKPDKSQGHFDGPATISASQILGGEDIIQEQLDDIAEKIDILKQEVAKLTPPLPQPLIADLKLEDNKVKQEKAENGSPQDSLQDKPAQTSFFAGNGGGGGGQPVYPKILISEIQVFGFENASMSSTQIKKQEFVELYNPNNTDIDLTGWYLQRKTKTGSDYSTFASNNLFADKKISALGYFLIARQDSSFTDSADIIVDNALTEDNSLIFKNPSRNISDKVGFGEAQDFELLPAQNPNSGQTIGRKIVSEEELDTDNNSFDFELQSPTPKAKNTAWVEPLLPDDHILINSITTDPVGAVTPSDTDIKSAPEIKPVLINEIQISPIEQRFVELYNPNPMDIDLTGWYLQRKKQGDDSFDSFVSSTNFEGKIILSGGYFLISREFTNSDILFDIALKDNDSLALKNPGREIIDKVGWGQASDPEGISALFPPDAKSITRTTGIDTNDNSQDFIILDTPTPKAGF